MIETDSKLATIALWTLAGAGWGLFNFVENRQDNNEKFDPKHLTTTVLVHAAAGGAIATAGDRFNVENLEYYSMLLGPYIDKLVNRAFNTRSKASEIAIDAS